MLADLREQVRATALAMFQAGLVVGTDGNVSAKDPETGYIAITPSSMPYDQITTDDIVIVDVNQNIIWGTRAPSWETPMHTYIHKHRADVCAVMHTHSWYATLFAIANRDLPPATMPLAAQFGGTVRCAPYVRTGSDDMGRINLEYLGTRGRAVLLGNHGTLCIAPNLKKVLQLSRTLEEGAKMVYQSALLGAPVPLPDPEIAWLHELVAGFEADEEKAVETARSHP
ncbi:MAG TPA: class II aldolase/adducin family protein [Anaerolineae bacterium]|nr:class II aldolase/adducin family protein [Anaerolineae bacterium]